MLPGAESPECAVLTRRGRDADGARALRGVRGHPYLFDNKYRRGPCACRSSQREEHNDRPDEGHGTTKHEAEPPPGLMRATARRIVPIALEEAARAAPHALMPWARHRAAAAPRPARTRT